jgi:hypothetical protein
MSKSKWYKIGKQRGINVGIDSYPRTDWKTSSARRKIALEVLEAVEYGIDAVISCPDPLSGEWAGESLVEIFGKNPTESMMENYESGFRDGFYGQLVERAKHEKKIADETTR